MFQHLTSKLKTEEALRAYLDCHSGTPAINLGRREINIRIAPRMGGWGSIISMGQDMTWIMAGNG